MTTDVCRRVEVTGVVQAVGFRPYVHSLATALGLRGSVRNVDGMVSIDLQGPEEVVAEFMVKLREEPPALAHIDDAVVIELDADPELGWPFGEEFRILRSESESRGEGSRMGVLPPDTAPCAACLAEMNDPADRRYRHAFIACTQCGPRFTIALALPHDRAHTTMAEFTMCGRCLEEYENPADRRHHAQPIACRECGPQLTFRRAGDPDPPALAADDGAVAMVHELLRRGEVLALKGIGGYHLAVDATSAEAVALLRRRKDRADKPFAVMVADLAAAREIAVLDEAEIRELTGPHRPVVLAAARAGSPVVDGVAPGSPLVGVMLPSSPLHHLLFRPVPGVVGNGPPTALVMTSGNLSGEPICHDDDDADRRLGRIADGFLGHDRRIHAPCDDSVIRVVGGSALPIRRSRGIAPLSVRLPFDVPATLAMGGDGKNVVCIADGRRAWLSQHIGDLANLASVDALRRSVELLRLLGASEPRRVVVDRHPAYRSRRMGFDLAREARDATVVEVDHHHAHAAALMAEHGLGPEESLLTFAFDGTGLGPDDTLWGGEVLHTRYDRAERVGHLKTVPLVGGAAAVANPCRMALAHLDAAGIAWADDLDAVLACDAMEREVVSAQLATGIPTSSIGRLFDAVSSILGIRHRVGFEAQAATELEFSARRARGSAPRLRFEIDAAGVFDPASLLADLVEARRRGVECSLLARAFHDAVAELILDLARRCSSGSASVSAVPAVGFTGGVFQNELLTTMTRRRLEQDGFTVLVHRTVPPNDAGLALGQVAIGAARHRMEELSTCV